MQTVSIPPFPPEDEWAQELIPFHLWHVARSLGEIPEPKIFSMSFLRNYRTYAEGDEVPQMFHILSAYACLSSAIFRKVWIPWADSAIYPNLYIMFVGDAGNGKSWAMAKAKRMLREVPDVKISGSVETPQGLIRWMCGNDKVEPPIAAACRMPVRWPDGQTRDTHPITIIANEFINFISNMPPEWINVLNDIYDEDEYHYRTKGQGEDIVCGPYVTMLAALTTEVSNDLQKQRIISTGLARRTIFQYGERRWNNPCSHPTFTAEQNAARAKCVLRLKQLRKLSGEFTWGPGTEAWWTKWYEPHLASVPRKSPQTRSWFASKSIQVLKLAMLTALSEGDELVVQIPHFEMALELLGKCELDLYKIFGGAGRNELTGIGVKMVEHLETLKTVLFWKELYVHCFHMFDKRDPMKDFEATVAYLRDTAQVAECLGRYSGSSLPVRLIGTPQAIIEFAASNGKSPPQPPV